MKMLRPAIWSVPGSSWGWVWLYELRAVLESNPLDIWRKFFPLSKDVESLAIALADGSFANVTEAGRVFGTAKVVDSELWSLVFDDNGILPTFVLDQGLVLVPAGWANAVVDAHQKGVVEVVAVDHSHLDDLDECPDGTLSCTFFENRFVAAVGLDKDGSPVNTGYGKVSRNEEGCCPKCFDEGHQPGHGQCYGVSKEARTAIETEEASLRLYSSRGWRVVWN